MKTKIFFIGLFISLQIAIVAQVPNTLTTDEKIIGLSAFWETAAYNFPYFSFLPNTNFDSLYQNFIPKVINTKNDFEYCMVLNRFAAYYRDNHTYIEFPSQDKRKYSVTRSNFTKYRIEISNIDGKPIVTRTGKSTINKLPVGSEILEVNHISAKEYIDKEVKPYFSASSKQRLQTIGIRNLLFGVYGTTVSIKFKKPDGSIVNLKLKRGKNSDEWYPAKNPSLFYKSIDDGRIACLRIDSFSDTAIVDSLKKYLPEIRKAKGVIIDIRKNMGGSSLTAKDIAKYFSTDTLIIGSKVRSRVNISTLNLKASLTPADTVGNAYYKWSYLCYHKLLLSKPGIAEFKNDISSDEKVIKPTTILIGPDNVSAAEEFLVFLRNQKHIVFIGENTGGGNGQPMIFKLPGGETAAVCTQNCSFTDGTDYYRVGIPPDIHTAQTYKDFIKNIDTVLERAKRYLEKVATN